mmetsp:Transcript_72652/g.235090  ORF Transcript_72652/g.235090 Transcript_72652/m.235090 type:complete len:432 (+) Transcript_72652:546-1841(+)
MVEKMRRLLQADGSGSRPALLQLRQKLAGASSPDVVRGVLKEMRSTFAADLKDMQEDEARARSHHDDLTSAKTREIETIKSQIASKEEQAATNGVQLTQRQELQDRSQALLEATSPLLAGLRDACEASDASFEARRQERQAEVTNLAEALAEAAGAQLLAIGARRATRGVGDLCLLAAGIADKEWRQRARTACDEAQAGRMQEAADTAEALEDDIREAAKSAAAEVEQCKQQHEEASAKQAEAAQEADVHANMISSDKQGADAQIQDISDQASTGERAKGELVEIQKVQRNVMQLVRMDAHNTHGLLQRAGASVPQGAAAKLHEAVAHSEKLAEAAADADARSSDAVQKLSGAFDAVVKAASRVLITLRGIRADAEEAAVSLKMERSSSAARVSAAVRCSAAGLEDRVQQLQRYAKGLEDATVALAYGVLR